MAEALARPRPPLPLDERGDVERMSAPRSLIAERLERLRQRIRDAALRAGRGEDEIRLLAVSKTQPPDAVREAYLAGQREFGENYVQELAKKRSELADLSDIRWHMIGHLQRNKVRLLGELAMLHSVDSVALARELGKRRALAQAGREDGSGRFEGTLPVLVEVNVGHEPQKSGCLPEHAADVASAVEAEPALSLSGLMTVPPPTETPEGARPYFEALRRLRDELGGAARLPELSMGMSFDLEQAILSGATIVRVGTLIFGERERSQGPR